MKKAVFIIICLIILTTGCSVKKVNKLTDQEKFANEFGISEKNKFVYSNINQILDIFNKGTGIIFLGNSDDESSLEAGKILYQASKSTNIDRIYYYNPQKLENKNPDKYQKLIKIMAKYLDVDEKNCYLKLPYVYAVKDGTIINYSNYLIINKDKIRIKSKKYNN